MSARSVVITGGSSGIGRAAAERLAAENFSIVVGYSSNKESALEVEKKIK